MSTETHVDRSTAQLDEYRTGPTPDAIITFDDDAHEGFIALVEHPEATCPKCPGTLLYRFSATVDGREPRTE